MNGVTSTIDTPGSMQRWTKGHSLSALNCAVSGHLGMSGVNLLDMQINPYRVSRVKYSQKPALSSHPILMSSSVFHSFASTDCTVFNIIITNKWAPRSKSDVPPPPSRHGVVVWGSFWGLCVHMTDLRARFLVWLFYFEMTSHPRGLLSVLRITTCFKFYGMVITHTKIWPQNYYYFNLKIWNARHNYAFTLN